MTIDIIETTPFLDQKPGTSGLRKKVSTFQQKHYTENFIQSIFNCLENIKNAEFVLGGDGRFYNAEVIQIILKIAAANGVKKIFVGQNGLLSTPAASHFIRKYGIYGGIILSASHNPGGKDGDFGIKYNMSNGSAASESLTEKFYEETQRIAYYKCAKTPEIDLQKLGETHILDMEIEIIDPIKDYADLMEEIFDFPLIRERRVQGLEFCFDAMHAVTGPYALEIFSKRLGFPKENIFHSTPLLDFGGRHPDPNPYHASQFYTKMMRGDAPDLGVASDGDGDRNFILGRKQAVSPSDSLAVILDYAHHIPYYKDKIFGVARSMPTSSAVDFVAKAKGIKYYETPTGWKFFGNLLDAQKISFCGEESYGTSSYHVREKDGIWAALFWLNLLALTRKSVKEILEEHWKKFGRVYYSRHDYEEVESDKASALIIHLRENLEKLPGRCICNMRVVQADDFSYHDPIEDKITKQQGIRIFFEGGKRLIFRLSGTGTKGATLRLFLESYLEKDIHKDIEEVLKPLIDAAQTLAQIKEYLQRSKPDVIV